MQTLTGLDGSWRTCCDVAFRVAYTRIIHNRIGADHLQVKSKGAHLAPMNPCVVNEHRARNWPLDKSTLYTVVTRFRQPADVPGRLELGSYISGLYLEGAAWDVEKSRLCPQAPKVLVQALPIMQVIPIEASKLKLHQTFRTPVYVTQARRNAMGVGLVFEAVSSHRVY
jgi:hypothetical protein